MNNQINQIKIVDFEGYVKCKADCDEFSVTCNSFSHTFRKGITLLSGDIDSGSWGISYALPMLPKIPISSRDFVIWSETKVFIDEKQVSMKDINQISCYMDLVYPGFNKKLSTRKAVESSLKKHNSELSAEDIRNLFEIDKDRYNEVPLRGVGNTKFRCMAAIGCAMGKNVFCFPWISKRMAEYYGKNLSYAIEVLKKTGKFVILPSNYDYNGDEMVLLNTKQN